MSEGAKSFLHFPTTSNQPISTDSLVDVFLGDKAEIEYYVEEMRRRHLSIVLLQGQDFIYLPRKMSGTRCPYWRTEESNCEKPLDQKAPCYNTGWIGGYNNPLIIKVIVPPTNRTAIAYEEGVRKEFQPRPWTIHTPMLGTRDLLVNRQSGFRFEVMDINMVLFRGLPMHQDFSMNRFTTDSPAYSVPVAIQ